MKIKVVLDTNVFISGLFWKNDCTKILELWNESKIILVTSVGMITELKRILNDFKIKYSKDKQERLFKKLLQDTDFILNVDTSKKYVLDDPDDDIFVQTAISGKAVYIISQDKHLLNLHEIDIIKIVTPRDFLLSIQE